MIVKRFGILWGPLEYNFSKTPTIFCVFCKLHNICMDRWMIDNPELAGLGNFHSVDSMEFNNDSNLWSSFDITDGVDDVFE